jgi:hypothetical protein
MTRGAATATSNFLSVVALALAAFAGLSVAQTPVSVSPSLSPGRKWVFVMTNFAADKRTDDLIALMRRAQKAGVNGFVVTDGKLVAHDAT